MRVQVESLEECYWTLISVREYLEYRGRESGHCIASCGCPICHAARDARAAHEEIEGRVLWDRRQKVG
jgi:hypothetical protein